MLALEHGATPATIVADVPTEFTTPTGLFAPVNYNRHCYGPMRYRLALANSLNISAVKVLASQGGPEPLQQLLRQCGLSTHSGERQDAAATRDCSNCCGSVGLPPWSVRPSTMASA